MEVEYRFYFKPNLWTSLEIQLHYERRAIRPKMADAENPFGACDIRREALHRYQALNKIMVNRLHSLKLAGDYFFFCYLAWFGLGLVG